ncbi:MAPEG family protein [Methylophaga sp.]|uniref:MAPEG family protein n=1 Tax=Methylophaga sp. TaxID=2024840 RepID=UPI003F6963D1
MPALFKVLFIVSLFPMVLAVLGGYLRYRQFGRFDNNHPRLQQAQLTGVASRVLAAQNNAWEALIFYAVMCVLAYVSGIGLQSLSYAAWLFLLSRIAHPVFYILGMAPFRSLVFIIGWFSTLYIGIQSLVSI